MIRKNKNAFTLVELLAVIVILAIILVIAVPKIMNVIKDTTKASLESSAKMVAAQVENQYTVAQTLGKEFSDSGSCMEDWAGLNDTDYESCTYEIVDGNAIVTLTGKSKFKGLSVCSGTRSGATATEGSCSGCKEEATVIKSVNAITPYEIQNYDSCVSYTATLFGYDVSELQKLCNGNTIREDYNFETYINDLMLYGGFTEKDLIENNVIKGTIEEETVCVPEYAEDAVTYINNLYNDTNIRSKFGLTKDNTEDQNIRYAGQYVQNYVEFGNTGELWRIIGTFEVEKASGGTEELVKIVRDEPFKDSEGNQLGMSWDSSAETINEGWGVNEWSQSDLKTMLNTYYIGEGTSCTYCTEQNQATCINSCNNSVTPISSAYASMIESVVWNTGAIEWKDEIITSLEAYTAERGSTTGKICTGGEDCNDSVTRTTEWEGKIGLIYPSDFGYAGGSTCTSIPWCGEPAKNNWLTIGPVYWTLSPSNISGLDAAHFVWFVELGAVVADVGDCAQNYPGVLPTLYLKSDVQIIDGDGSSGNPYKLK